MVSTNATRDELAEEGLRLVRYQACQYRDLPPGLNRDDLESAGNEAVVEALHMYDPACGVSFTTFAKTTIRSRMLDAIRARTRRTKREVSLQRMNADGESVPLPADPKAADPADTAAARERSRVRVRTTVKDLVKSLPSPDDVARRVIDLRAAMFAAVKPEDVAEVMYAVVSKAQNGDLKAAQMLINLLGPSSGVTVQTVVVQRTEEEG